MNEYVWETAEEINLQLAKRISGIRKRRGITQEWMSDLSGVSFGSVKRFERTGQICDLLRAKQGIPGNAVYVTYHPVSDWGWNGKNF